MIEIEEKDKCCGCYGCFNICPVNAISMKEDSYGFRYPVVDKEKCINCGMCEKVCPILNKPKRENINKDNDFNLDEGINKNIVKINTINKTEHNFNIENSIKENKSVAFAAYNKNKDERIKSSSGGIFTLIAKAILNEGGLVYGASFDNDFSVKHVRIDKTQDIEKLRTSKYVQSLIGDTYKNAKKDLEEGKKVLFTGTPCQINGLYAYLQKNYDNLYTQDIICHGVPSPKVWREYLKYREIKDQKKPMRINFRQKVPFGWNLFSLSFDNEYNTKHGEDQYMKMFLQNVSLRDSCFNCNFKDKNRISDITLADFWGINKVEPEMNDDKGTSLLIINSKKGIGLLEKIRSEIEIKETNLDEAIKYNPAMIASVPMNPNRENFFRNINELEKNNLKEKNLGENTLGESTLQKSTAENNRLDENNFCILKEKELEENKAQDEELNFEKIVKKYEYKPSFMDRVKGKCKRVVKKILRKK